MTFISYLTTSALSVGRGVMTEAGANRAPLVRNLLDWQYEDPVRIVAFNTAEGRSRDVTVQIADRVRRRFIEGMTTHRLRFSGS